MFVIYDKEKQKFPIKVWLEKMEDLEGGALEQAINMSNLPFVHHHISLMPDVHQGYGVTIGGVLTTKGVIVPNAVGVDIGCVDKDTEFLTPNGWKKISKYQDNDEVMVYDLNANSSFFERPNYVKLPCDEFYHIKTKYGVDQMLSEEHKLLMFKGSHHREAQRGEPFDITMEEVFNKHSELKLGFRDKMLTVIPNANLQNKKINMTDQQVRVQVMVMADGHIIDSDKKHCRCRFVKQRKIDRCIQLLEMANIPYSLNKDERQGCTDIHFISPSSEKRIGLFWGASIEQLRIIVDEILNWDGYYEEQNVYFTRVKEDADFLQYALAVCGFRSTITIDERESGIDYRVIKSDNQYVGFAGTPKTPISKVKSIDGFKYCFTTSTGYWIMRRNGCIVITGNCGMGFVETNIKADDLTEQQYKALVGQIMRNIPTGFGHHRIRQESKVLDRESKRLMEQQIENGKLTQVEEMVYNEVERGYFQLGTLGGGNHFIELQKDDEGYLCVMLHSGSRNFGYKIAKYFNDLAQELNKKWYSTVPSDHDLAFLPMNTQEGKDYVRYMNLALDFAEENRSKMLEVVMREIQKVVPSVVFGDTVNAHHNYASMENHFGSNVWVHRKGAIRVREGEIGIIPSAMGGYSYIVKGKGNPESFHTCSHGAGRKMGRKQAERTFTTQEVMEDLKERGVILGKHNKEKVADECIWAYKDIDYVIENELDLIEVVKRVKTIAVIKG